MNIPQIDVFQPLLQTNLPCLLQHPDGRRRNVLKIQMGNKPGNVPRSRFSQRATDPRGDISQPLNVIVISGDEVGDGLHDSPWSHSTPFGPPI
jgi:hypothetical protein